MKRLILSKLKKKYYSEKSIFIYFFNNICILSISKN